MTAKLPVATESAEQRALFQWAALAKGSYPELKILHHVPNGGKRDKVTAARLSAEGVKPGVPDICLPVARSGYHGLYIELKRRTSGRVSAAQRWWIARLQEQGYRALVCYGWQQAREEIEKYLGGSA